MAEGRKREVLLRSTEALLDPIVAATRRDQRRLKGQEKIALRVGKVVGQDKMAKYFDLKITEGSFGYRRKLKAITRKAALDGLYIVRTSLPASEFDVPGTVSAYKRLSQVECAFRSFKTVDLTVRPIFHYTPDRVRVFVVYARVLRGMAYAPGAGAFAARRHRPGHPSGQQ